MMSAIVLFALQFGLGEDRRWPTNFLLLPEPPNQAGDVLLDLAMALADDYSVDVGAQQKIYWIRGTEFWIGELQVLKMGPGLQTLAASSGEESELRQDQGGDGVGLVAVVRSKSLAAWFLPMMDWKRSRNEGQSSYFPVKVGG
ncbi:uncharacterized protein LOC114941315 isoform X2 [Nylanderia fulva]|uniref:uncharacterized protein LOC114941243 n=1 Tax=Nylanderia fulva TaxID=613905 RepID=UPI0010FB92BA|nr:uncharacterized protein LOC114928153 isoform X2 [Nylanderia fulva]XP_029157615.1 uncharacterized protein LOC114930044 isoform X2 [Nylanderia fulva]XP_029172002.1 uncharacterized protein LOC114941243 [Nylanderia fulva]XP_029172003.1 uncharacterized protein LOC114941243 [Nylanderia fulva]XP_029172084.1 uncharacterized protein LOC114941315 isoform X2 [Nylanderia fulva]